MKPIPSSRGRREGRGRMPGRAGGDAGRSIGLAGAGLLVTLLLGWAVAGGWARHPAATRRPGSRELTVGRYLKGGYWRADARTLLAAGRWLLEGEGPGPAGMTNLAPVPRLSSTNQPSGQTPA